MKTTTTHEFTSFEAFDASGTAGNYEDVTIIRENGKICADLMTECKSWKTALNRFFRAVANIPELAGWEPDVRESCESGYFADRESIWNEETMKSEVTGNWSWEVEDHDGAWYVCLNIRIQESNPTPEAKAETTTQNHNEIMELSVRATAGTLKRIYSGGASTVKADGSICANAGSANTVVRKLRQSLQADLHHLENLTRSANAATKLEVNNNPNSDNYGLYQSVIDDKAANEYVNKAINDYCISDAYDLVTVAYSYLYDRIAVQGMSAQDTETRTLKNGTTKERTVYQWACVEVRKAIYAEKSIESNGKYSYIEDMAQDGETSDNALDREYIRMGKYYDMGGTIQEGGMSGTYTADNGTYETAQSMLAALNLTKRQELIIKYRLQGLGVTAIADKLDVSKAAISKTLSQIQAKVTMTFPELVRAFNTDKWAR